MSDRSLKYCAAHAMEEAFYRCPKCDKYYCDDCCYSKIVNEEKKLFCRVCDAPLETLAFPYYKPAWSVPSFVFEAPLKMSVLKYILGAAAACIAGFYALPQSVLNLFAGLLSIPIVQVFLLVFFALINAKPLVKHYSPPFEKTPALWYLFAYLRFLLVALPAIALCLGFLAAYKQLPELFAGNIKTMIKGVVSSESGAFTLIGLFFVISLWVVIAVPAALGTRSLKKIVNPVFLVKLASKEFSSLLMSAFYLTAAFCMAVPLVMMTKVSKSGTFNYETALGIAGIMYLWGVAGAIFGWRVFEIRGEVMPYDLNSDDEQYRLRIKTKSQEIRSRMRTADRMAQLQARMEGKKVDSRGYVMDENNLALLEQQQRLDPENPQLMRELLNYYEHLERIEEAKNIGTKLVAYYLNTLKFDEAAQTYQELCSYDKKLSLPPFQMVKLGEFYERGSEWQSSCIVWRNLAVQNPDSPLAPQALYRCARALDKLGKVESAVAALRKTLRDYPECKNKAEVEKLLNDIQKQYPGQF